MLDQGIIHDANGAAEAAVQTDYDRLGEALDRQGIAIAEVARKVAAFAVAVPSWGVGTGGTRFARFPGGGEPRNVFDKLDDCGVVHQLTGATPTVSLHIPWDAAPAADLLAKAEEWDLGFDAINSNTFQDSPDQALSYKFGSLSHTDPAVRAHAVAHNLDCIALGREIGSRALTIWIGDGSNFPGQAHFRRQFDRYLASAAEIYAGLPADWTLFTEHKMYEPAFYSTVVADWGSNLMIAQALGERAKCLVDLGHHAPNTNIELIVARLMRAGKLGGFHFNDSKYGDDDLDAGSVDPYRLFLIFNELAVIEGAAPAYMIDQSHNVTDPIESLMASAMEIQRAYAQALLVDRVALAGYQEENDALMASETLKRAFRVDVSPLLARVRIDKGAAADPVAAFRASGYRARVTAERPAQSGGSGGIV